MPSKVTKSDYSRVIRILIFVISGAFLLVGIWGTFAYSPDKDKQFYIYYIIFSLCSILIGNIAVSFLSRPITESLIDDTNTQIDKLTNLATNQIEKLTNVVHSFRGLGVAHATIDLPDFEWGPLIQESTEIRLAFKSHVNWLRAHKGELTQFLSNPKANLYVLLPDTTQTHLTEQLAAQRKKSPTDVIAEVDRAKGIFATLERTAPGRVHCKAANTVFVSHFYIFPRLAVVTMRSLNNGWRSPHFICENSLNGKNIMYSFANDQFDEFWKHRSTPVDLKIVVPSE